MTLSRRELVRLLGLSGLTHFLPALNAQTSFTYYVDANIGNDANDGRSATRPKRSLSSLSSLAVRPGESIGLARGGIWRETLALSVAGQAGQPIRIGAYGAGDRPRICASERKQFAGDGQPAAVQPQPQPQPAELFRSGFDDYALRDWDGRSTFGAARLAVGGAPGGRGGRGLAVTGDGRDNRAFLTRTLPSALQSGSYFVSFAVYFGQGSFKRNSELRVFRLVNGSAGSKLFGSFNVNSAGRFETFTLNGHASGCGGLILNRVQILSAMSSNRWIEFRVEIRIGSSGGARLWVNGNLVAEQMGRQTSGLAGVDTVTFGSDAYGGGLNNGQSIWFDDFAANAEGAAAPPPPAPSPSTATIWRAVQIDDPLFLSYAGQPGRRVSSASALSQPGDWFWDSGGLQLVVRSDVDPSSLVEIPARPNAIRMNDCAYLELSDLSWSGARDQGLFSRGRADSIRLSNCLGELNYEEAAEFLELGATMNGCVVEGCEFRFNGSTGFLVNGRFTNWSIRQSSFHHNCLVESSPRESHRWQAGLKLWGENVHGAGTVVEGCNIFENGSGSSAQDKGIGLWIDEVTGVTLRSNVVSSNHSWGVYLEKTINCFAVYNLSVGNARAALYCAGLGLKASSGDHSRGNRVYHNTVYDSGYWGLYVGTLQSLGFTRFDDNHVRNNIVVGSRYQVVFVEPGGNNNGVHGSGNVYTHNCFGPDRSDLVYWSGANVNYSGFQSRYGAQTYSVQADPQFSDASRGSFSLRSSSPCIDAGLRLSGFSQAIAGSGPNLGAFE